MDYYKISLIITIVFVLIFTVFNFYSFLFFLDKKHLSNKYCNECKGILSINYIYCPKCGRLLEEYCDLKLNNDAFVRDFVIPFKKLYKKNDLVRFTDINANFFDFGIKKCDLNSFMNEIEMQYENFLDMKVVSYKGKRVRDGFLKSHVEFIVEYDSNYIHKCDIYDDIALERLNGGNDND